LGSNPIVNTLYDLDVHTHEEGAFNLTENHFKMAFAVRDYGTINYKADVKYVKWSAIVIAGDGSTEKTLHTLGTHICTIEDWKKFNKPSKKDEAKFKDLSRSEVMHCMNDLDDKGIKVDYSIWGADDGRDHRRLDLVLSPCVEDDGPECINKKKDTPTQKDKKKAEMMKWLGQGDLTMVFNSQRKDMRAFGDKSIVSEARITNKQFD
jgi:hypothetical protein